jgi:N utilization substance protein B
VNATAEEQTSDQATPTPALDPPAVSTALTPATRRQARLRAVEILFEADIRRVHPCRILDERVEDLQGTTVETFLRDLVSGVAEHRSEIDEQLATYARGWPPHRMPAVDRALARLGAYEINFDASSPPPVILKEIADIASQLSTDKSPDFLSGLLGRLANIRAAFS